MSYELVKQWIDDPDSVTEDQIDQALQTLYTGEATGAIICLVGALTSIKEGTGANVAMLIERYERQI